MKTPLLALSITLAQAFTAYAQSPAPAAPPQPLDQRVEKLEGDISQILQLLKDQQKQATAPTNAASPDSANSATPAPQTPNSPAAAAVAPASAQKTANLKPGAILEVWTLKPDFQGDAPTTRSIGGMIDQGEYFSLTNFIDEPSLANQKSNRVALKWSGLYKAKEAGTYVFTVDISKGEEGPLRGGHKINWNVDLAIDAQSLLTCKPDFQTYGQFAFSDSAEVKMEPGYYPLSLLTFFTDEGNELPATDWNYKGCKVTIKVRGPSDMLPKTISSQDLFHKE